MGALDRVFRGRRGGQDRPLAAIVAGLWRNGEQGAWYDSSDLSTMFQDPAGTTPVYMPGQGQPDPWIGLQLDKRLGLVRGPERLTNGYFSAGGTPWAITNADATHVVTFSSGTMRFQCDTLTPALQVQQTGVMTVGRWYEITTVASAHVAGSIKTDSVMAGGSGLVLANGQGTYRMVGVAMSGAFALTRGAANTDITIDSISIRELPGNHRWQGTATSRPVLSARYNLLTATEQFDASVWIKNASSVVGGAKSPTGALTAYKLVENTASAVHHLTQLFTPVIAVYRFSLHIKAAERTKAALYTWASGGISGQVAIDLSTGSVASGSGVFTDVTVIGVGAGWYRVSGLFSNTTTTSREFQVRLLDSGRNPIYTGDGVSGVYVWGADLRVENDGVGLPTYQRVADANNYDTVGFPLYRKPDGIDDWMQTASVDFSVATQITVAAALRKMSDAARAVAIELGTSAESTAGNYSLEAPSAVLGNVLARASGTSVNTVQAASLPAPAHVVVQARLDPASGVALRTNAGPWAANPVAFGGGFAAAPLYFDRRAGTSLPSAARDYGTIIVDRLLTGPETAAVEKFLRQKSRAY